MRDNIKLSMLINADENRSIHAHTNDGSPVYGDGRSSAVNKKAAESDLSVSGNSPTNMSTEYEDKHPLEEEEDEKEKTHKKRRGRRRRLKGPPYICEYPGCGKCFQRSEHLARHKLNHNPKKIFQCTQPGCKKTFVRHDLLVRHLKRHANRIQKERKKMSEGKHDGKRVGSAKRSDVEGSNEEESGVERKKMEENNLQIANLQGANLRGISMQGDMQDGMQNANMRNANVRNTNMAGTNMQVAMQSTNLGNNNLENSNVPNSNLENETTPLKPTSARTAPGVTGAPGGAGVSDRERMKFAVNNTGMPRAASAQPQNTKGFSSVTQILQQHNHSLADTPEPANNKDFSAPNLLNWLFSDNTSNPAADQRPNSRLNVGVAQSDTDDFLTGLNEFQMNNGGQSFFIPDGFDQLSPASSSNLGLYSSPGSVRSPGGSVRSATGSGGGPMGPMGPVGTAGKGIAGTGIAGQTDSGNNSGGAAVAKKNQKIHPTPSMTMNCEPVATAEKASIDAVLEPKPRAPHTRQSADRSLFHLTAAQLEQFSSLIPEIKAHPDFVQPKLEKALRMYWKFFHPRFPMLHRPSFDSVKTPPLLLLAMVMLGIKLSQCVDDIKCPGEERFENAKDLADKIALPLRWLIFASPQFQPPAKLWIIQSLLMLEFYEKNCTTRQLHERAHLHHGTTIQLLRRSPTLGGSPHKIDSGDDYATNWFKWIEIESMKRATFMCFYMDAIDAISFGHQMLIYAHQIQMTMPVQDEVWESKLRNFRAAFKRCKQPRPFLLVLKSILNGVPTRTNSFGKKVLLAGLSAIMFQIQQRDMQLMFGLDKFGMSGTVNNWRELLTAAFSIWRNDVGGSCCSSRTAIDNMSSMKNSQQFSTSDTRCKCITYHMAHVYMSISHYDLFIVAGAPWRMNVKPSSNLERNQIETRVHDWTKTRHSKVCVVQCYLLLFEMFLSPQDSSYEYQYDYLPDQDLFFRSYVIGLCTMVLWCYIHARYGPDAYKKTKHAYLSHEYEEDGYRYLKRIRNELTRRSGGVMLHTWFSSCTGAEFYGKLVKWVNVLDDVPDKQNLVGLLDLVGNKLVDADYTVVKEIGKLLLFCRDRCRGSSDDVLMNMYE